MIVLAQGLPGALSSLGPVGSGMEDVVVRWVVQKDLQSEQNPLEQSRQAVARLPADALEVDRMLPGQNPNLMAEPGGKRGYGDEMRILQNQAFLDGQFLPDYVAIDASLLVVVIIPRPHQLLFHVFGGHGHGDQLRMGMLYGRRPCPLAVVLEDEH